VNKDAVQKWVDELIFGNHPQTSDELYDSEGYCGLGVACLVYGKENGLEIGEVIHGLDYQFGYVPTKVQKWLGIDGEIEQEVIRMNDTEEVSLPDIGVYIRDRYLKDE